MIILGIDPGTATTGYGLVEKIGRNLSCLDYGSIETSPSSSDAERLECLYDELNLLMRKTKPDVLAVEKLYFFKNSKTAMTVAQAKGVILLAGAKKRIPIFEFTPLQMKTTVAGYGRAEKSQIQKMVKVILSLKKIPRPDDAADALGIAICCARQV
jgi:crossover junction endodeoxyribonuclease RuvC